MITRLEIDGFKSFENFAVDLSPFTVIVGNNAAGKSNLFDAVQLLARLATHDVAEAMKGLRGEPLELFRRTPSGRVVEMTFAAEVLVDRRVRDPWGSEVEPDHTRIRYEVRLQRRTLRAGIERVQVSYESATTIQKGEDRWVDAMDPSERFRAEHLVYRGRRTTFLSTDEEREGLVFHLHQSGHAGRKRPASAAEATVLYGVTNAEFPHLFALRQEMQSWRSLQLDPAQLRKPAPVTAADVLDEDGSNLAAVLARLKAETATAERPEGVLRDIAVELHALIPDVASIDAELHEASREYRIELTMRDGLPFSSRVVSDGTLRVLALLTLLHDPRHRGLVCFEEPENGVHPARVRALVARLRDLVSNPDEDSDDGPAPLSQLLINSHSPVVLGALIDGRRRTIYGTVLFADSTTISDPMDERTRRRTRLRPVRAERQVSLLDPIEHPDAFVSDFEVRKVLELAAGEN